MNMLEMPEAQRTELQARSALAIDGRGQELLLGLNAEESRFFIACMQRTPSRSAERERYAELKVRHEAARFKLASVDDESTGDEEGPPHLGHKF
ncbi:hypothetical protein C7T35_37565 [Variovorax sp. WS11]|uniref:hypothetical protein n=1 Tax=Variovorax sp. WS11 TaxID=1105204 RepID=UPI000D0DE920|nr:hypothetical protein [Variovorax sp. WS11]NDZ13803.1 hypothetical protein [Variovorax sp. WS11]PSL79420.1 hypothetical protein C7T35_37565 [Variovorax sp. WS11]